jgi:hypothetical protein
MQRATHIALQRLVDHLVLLHAAFATEGFGYDGCGVVIAIARKIADFNEGVGQRGLYQALDFLRLHRHGVKSLLKIKYTPQDERVNA